MNKDFNIIYRVCDLVESVNNRRDIGTKKQVLNASFLSLTSSIEYAKSEDKDLNIVLKIVFDNTSEETIDKIKKTLEDKKIVAEFLFTDAAHGNVQSFKLAYETAKKLFGYVFFLEDDYILEKQCVIEMAHFLKIWSDDSHICLKPHQEIAEFIRDGIEKDGKYFQREVFLSESRYWIRIKKSTCTFLIDDFILKDCEDFFLKTIARNRLDETYLNQIFEKYPLFSPIEPLADHAHTIGGMRPYLNGRKLKLNLKYQTVNFLK